MDSNNIKKFQTNDNLKADEILNKAENKPTNNEDKMLKELEGVSDYQIRQMISQAADMVRTLEYNFNVSKSTWKLTNDQVKDLYQYNEQHKAPMPKGLSEEEQRKWDMFNSFDNITYDEAIEILGSDSLIIPDDEVPKEATDKRLIDRLKSVTSDFFFWMSSLSEYQSIHNAYLRYIELQEEEHINELRKVADNETDPEKKKKMDEAIDKYYYNKNIEFIKDITEEDVNRIIKAFKNGKQIEYWINRCKDKLKSMNISSKFILEISQFEKRFLDEKYHKQDNILLLYFCNIITYSDIGRKEDEGRVKCTCMVFALDGFVRNTLDPKLKEKILNNIIEFEDKFIDKI